MAQGHRIGVAAQFRNVLANRVIQRQFFLSGQEVNGKRGELLGHGREVEYRICSQRLFLLDVSKPCRALYDKGILFLGTEHTTWASFSGELLENSAHVVFDLRRCGLNHLAKMFGCRRTQKQPTDIHGVLPYDFLQVQRSELQVVG
ncbi:hypothetical protein D3C79_735000 [compost metagenome]